MALWAEAVVESDINNKKADRSFIVFPESNLFERGAIITSLASQIAPERESF